MPTRPTRNRVWKCRFDTFDVAIIEEGEDLLISLVSQSDFSTHVYDDLGEAKLFADEYRPCDRESRAYGLP